MILKNLKSFFKENSRLNLLVLAIIFLIPLAWSRYLNANYVSAKFFLVYLVSSLSLIVSFRKLRIPQLSKTLWVLLISIFCLHFLTLVMSQRLMDVMYLFKFISLCFLIYYFYSLGLESIDKIVKKITYAIFIVSGLVLLFAILDFYTYRIVNSNLQSGYLLGSFGNVNMMTEFMVLTVPLIFYWLQFKDRVPYFVKFIFFTLWIFFILYCRSRSSWIALGLWALWPLIKGGRRKELLLAFPIALICYLVAVSGPAINDELTEIKKNSFKERASLYKATAQMISENPLGVGVGHFDSYLVPYQINAAEKPNEYLHYDQPHSEILRWAAQLGWLGLLLALSLLGTIFWYLFLKRNQPVETSLNRNFLAETFLALMPQILFQFPYFNPATIVYMSFIFALFLSLFRVRHQISLSWKTRLPIFVLAIAGCVHAIIFVTSIYFESTQVEDFEKISIACDLYPINQNACFLKTYHLLKNSQLPQARLQMQQGFDNFLFHRGLLRLLPTYLKYTAGDNYSCEAITAYAVLFPRQTFFDESVRKNCAYVKAPIEIKEPQAFRKDFQYWMNRKLQK